MFALIITPTRELAYQIAEQFRVFGNHIGLKDTVVVGGIGKSLFCTVFSHIKCMVFFFKFRYDETRLIAGQEAPCCYSNSWTTSRPPSTHRHSFLQESAVPCKRNTHIHDALTYTYIRIHVHCPKALAMHIHTLLFRYWMKQTVYWTQALKKLWKWYLSICPRRDRLYYSVLHSLTPLVVWRRWPVTNPSVGRLPESKCCIMLFF